MNELKLSHKIISTSLPAFVMGILNATPDSFYGESRGGIQKAKELIEQGADILDIGGESTKPGNAYISTEEELQRVIPLVKAIREFSDIPISIDTRKLEVMKQAFDCGADILNDISALEDDENMANWCAQYKIPVILMHKRGNPQNMQLNTEYENVVEEVKSYFEKRISYAKNNGIKTENIILDPGIGFGKKLADNVALIKKCGEFCNIGGEKFRVLMALSRKSCIGELTGETVENRLSGTLAANMIAVQNGATLLRVHDVKETIDMLKVMNELKLLDCV